MPTKTYFRFISIFLFIFLTGNLAVAQKTKHPIHRQKDDSVVMEQNSRLSDSILREADVKDTTIPYMVSKIESYTFNLNRSENFFDHQFDTAGILKSISGQERRLNYFHNRLNQNDKPMNLRSLNTALVMLGESQETLEDWDKSLAAYITQLNSIHQRIRLVKHDSSLLNDSLNTILHGQMNAVYTRSLSLDTLYHTTAIKISALRNRVSINLLLLKDLTGEITERKQAITHAMWNQEEPPFFKACIQDYNATLGGLIQDATVRATRVIGIFMATTWDTRSINLAIWLLLLIWFLVTGRVISKMTDRTEIIQNLKFLKQSAFLSSLLLLVTYSPFLYDIADSAPAVYKHLLELFRILLLSVLLFPYLTPKGKAVWFGIAVLWVSFAIDDILLDSAYGERWGLMIGGVILLALCLWLLRKNTVVFKNLDDSPARKTVLVITVVQIVFSIVCNLTGRVTLSKLLAFSSVNSLVLAITFKVCCTILVDAIYTQTEVFQNRFFAFLNFIDLKNKLRKVLWVITIILWIFSILQNLMLNERVSSILLYFIKKPRSIGSFTFTYASGLLFVLIIWISSVLSEFVSFFFDEKHNPGPKKKTKLGSIALLVRIGIWTTGFLIAVAAAGIPINKISILLGALGVGIGFGLQNLVNNLVSGIIIAFERPIQIGDTIEISGKTGMVQEIGVRSSQISNGEGANIIIPNGDLLSQQLVNWTLHNRNKRIKVVISVPIKSDFRKARDLVLEEISKNKKIMLDPKPAVTVDTFANNAVNYEIKFWVPDMSETGNIRNELMLDIIESFLKNGIAMV